MSVLNSVPFEKYHGTGNEFFVVDAEDPVPDRPAFARTHCDRDAGIVLTGSDRRGADGVLFLALESRYDPPRVVMTLVQPDGSVAAMCGNGARVAAAWAAERANTDEIMIDTPAGTRRATVDGNEVNVEMGIPSFDPRDVPLESDDELVEGEVEGLTVTAVNTGVPHAVAFVDDVDDVDLESVAPSIRHAPLFSEGANVTIASPDGEGGFRQRTFERGIEGETQSCGTGAVAVVAVAKRLGLVSGDDPVSVSPPGGALSVTVPDEGTALLGGPAVREGNGEADIVFRQR
ncbi:diaminopimelate epimerase [Haloferax mediterranei ATCC 33500]|uniref:Diaminopimelate epimerase n=1 Tax=Haloferax mediterranei (strain ATCC 33500 / DSM 1411 / JCM 8866 / NBRC 14739 / NCIMB 2177 / R-4) TaxID=523841 RepID=I3R3L1_HALMT|nr:diaminopimelate epimerase [Haloferax mediterranei]AFK18821.1 diaminopimelate epimerase (DAP epimerase) [Haloferax mediterranei ATCC 33500]AHZ21812.1 diaminopimelate epimerase [Haloferax mediterranei ATCC 33500]EMA03321.1 diaminopimelate epimerase [Haloferax mediterranei ATCC 33500]MDX5988914.1 diaminopimelate epimerase [Haloferax mediterranei ATCC 33500]QCQ75312.1 diaminopimelate epimerase [Haloferax mediterranei ATCC 33500]